MGTGVLEWHTSQHTEPPPKWPCFWGLKTCPTGLGRGHPRNVEYFSSTSGADPEGPASHWRFVQRYSTASAPNCSKQNGHTMLLDEKDGTPEGVAADPNNDEKKPIMKTLY